MRLLLDTHAFIWWLAGNQLLSEKARLLVAETSDVFVSAASAWEIATKYRLGKMPDAAMLATDVAGAVTSQNFTELPISLRHGQFAGALAGLHKDPFDRMLAAQAMLEDMALVSNDSSFDTFAVHRVW